MRASDVRVAKLATYTACAKAIAEIESDHQNTVGGYKAWVSGRTTTLTQAAQRKIAAIERKMERVTKL